ncbi:MAG TPA: serine protease [Mycobacteriales bacterium]|nr:serine protease [Mycobacteriales bacterium]
MNHRRVFALALSAVVAGSVLTAGSSAAAPPKKTQAAPPAWAPAATATVKPGVMTYTDNLQCTANFVYTDRSGAVYLGQSAHCASLSGSFGTNGCEAESRPLGTPVEVTGASKPGVLAYSSWISMRAAKETNPDICENNDFALVRLDPADIRSTNPSVPVMGGPTGLDEDGAKSMETIYTYGNSSLRLGFSPLRPKQCRSLGGSANGWSHTVYCVTPGIPGDSGSGHMTSEGKALGTLSTFDPTLRNWLGDLPKMLAYARRSLPSVTLVNGTEPFTGRTL